MNNKLAGLILFAIGFGLYSISLVADIIGLGIHPYIYYGWKQILGIIAGLGLVLAGLILAIRTPASPGAQG